MRFDNILVTTDFSEDAEAAFDLAAYHSKMEGAKVTLLTVIEDWAVPDVLLGEIPNPERIVSYRKELREKALAKLNAIVAERFHNQKAKVEVLLSTKSTGNEICDYATNNKINLIVMASHGRGGLGKALLGSVVERVLRFSPCPVLVIPKRNG